ncbi:WXG100 family type VII secretion target [Streptomyces nondiastaticus]|uniref:WXG100 family type VII secretion target n=1 Tax=Streptomyces TaxID=1883 RepID=UPI002676FB4D|nr:WXG100 family type VII secretion target [Streptomyces sp. VNUA116]WKU46454.1 WXG100 family type VII secretion target [Streptomyces sp. VNUA116]
MQGADLKLLRELSRDFAKKAKELQALITHLNTKTTSSDSYWKGPKSNSFREEWGNVKPTFEKFVHTLEGAGKAAATNADNIERAT